MHSWLGATSNYILLLGTPGLKDEVKGLVENAFRNFVEHRQEPDDQELAAEQQQQISRHHELLAQVNSACLIIIKS